MNNILKPLRGDRIIFYGGYGDSAFAIPGVYYNDPYVSAWGVVDEEVGSARLDTGAWVYGVVEQFETLVDTTDKS
jgi:hypothetical protein